MALPAFNRFAWLKSGLLWRTFFLLAFLITVSVVAWTTSYRLVERGPRAEQTAAEIISIVTITRAALTHTAEEGRSELLFDLASNEGIRVYTLEATDKVEPAPNLASNPELISLVRARLGKDTRFSERVNDNEGVWISFHIDQDNYWLMLDASRLERNSGFQWLQWGSIALLLSLIGAVFISSLINQPLARLSAATRAIAKGEFPAPLPEEGPIEIEEANKNFNKMVEDLRRIESDRAIILAGISHDLRTPLSRMLLEVEMARLDDDARLGMQSDLAQMDSIIGQFLDYARPVNANIKPPVLNASDLLQDVIHTAARQSDLQLNADIAPALEIQVDDTEIRRVINNIIENARRYGRQPEDDQSIIDLNAYQSNDQVVIDISDHGPGIPAHERERLFRPFTRLNTARSQANGSGLGLAIVSRVINRYQGKVELLSGRTGGLMVRITLPAHVSRTGFSRLGRGEKDALQAGGKSAATVGNPKNLTEFTSSDLADRFDQAG